MFRYLAGLYKDPLRYVSAAAFYPVFSFLSLCFGIAVATLSGIFASLIHPYLLFPAAFLAFPPTFYGCMSGVDFILKSVFGYEVDFGSGFIEPAQIEPVPLPHVNFEDDESSLSIEKDALVYDLKVRKRTSKRNEPNIKWRSGHDDEQLSTRIRKNR